MKVFILCGSPRAKGCTYTALTEMKQQFEKNGIETVFYELSGKKIEACIDCKSCWGNAHCVFEDACNDVIQNILEADAVVIGAPVYFGGIPGSLKCLLDRVFYDAKRLYSHKLGAAVVSCRRGGAETAFDQINKYYQISSMPVISSQYWNSVHGDTPDEVRDDLEGMQTVRRLADNMSWLLKCIEAGKQAGIEPVEPEKRVKTSFYKPHE